ncbi:MAG: recombinase family protein [Alphaproteobacteria bacterium]
MSRPKVIRCAIYTRKSTDEGLEQDFNSLHAQREACEAYIKSQVAEGWRCLPEHYDDGGYSGGNTDRPGLQALLQAIQARQLDVIVVYKIDRLTRSLADFARLAELFDAQAISFVSVTQQFNTTTSMGRLTLNMLLSFAQFEREITGERIRDKIAASKKKGMWMGGNVPVGYDAVDRRLVIDPAGAETIRSMFRLYLEAGDVPALALRLEEIGVRTRARVVNGGKPAGGLPYRPGHLYQLLSNPLYIGQIRHKDQTYPGEHEAIIDQPIWDAVQAQLAQNTQGPRTRRGRAAQEPSLLAGLVVASSGNRFTPSHANKGGRRYRYYIEQAAPEADLPPNWRRRRIPALDLEGVVREAVDRLLGDQAALVAAAGTGNDAEETEMATLAARRLQLDLRIGDSNSWHELLRPLLQGIEFDDKNVRIAIDRTQLRASLRLEGPLSEGEPDAYVLDVAVRVKTRGVRKKMTVGAAEQRNPADADLSLIKAITRAHDWFDRLSHGEADSVHAIADAESVTSSYVSRILRLAFLAPGIVEAVLDRRQAFDVYTQRLNFNADIPLSWQDQRQTLGMG